MNVGLELGAQGGASPRLQLPLSAAIHQSHNQGLTMFYFAKVERMGRIRGGVRGGKDGEGQRVQVEAESVSECKSGLLSRAFMTSWHTECGHN